VPAEIEGVADVVTGAALARAAEPAAGEGGDHSSAAACLNCGAPLAAAYCGACGQKAHVHRTLAAFGHDALHSLLHFDGKVWRTLPLLTWKPGQLTRRYVHGERAKFVSPLALFLFCVFLAFAVFGWAGPKMSSVGPPVAADIDKELAEAKAEILADIKELEGDKADATATEKLRQIRAAQSTLAAQKARSDTAIVLLEAQRAEAKKTGAATLAIEDGLAAEMFNRRLIERAAESLHAEGLDGGKASIAFDSNEGLSAKGAKALKNPQLLLYKVQSNAYKYAWLLIPLSVPFVWLLFFWKRGFKLFDHAVFVTYSLCFMLTLGTVAALVMRLPKMESAAMAALLVIPPIHLYQQTRHAYGLSHFSTAWRTLLLLGFASTALGLFAAMILTMGVTG
jgi:Protein of unknown function (DUF3667)